MKKTNSTKLSVFFLLTLLSFSCSTQNAQAKMEPAQEVVNDRDFHFYQSKYPLQNPNQKLIDNKGEGFDDLYGLRNMRFVLNGLLYRGGGNNKYHKYDPKSNMNPLPKSGLENLCKEGFQKAVYLYRTNYSNSPKTISCTDINGKANKLEYLNLVAHEPTEITEILEHAHKAIVGNNSPIYIHCWNGWHASGLVSAMALRQFCGWSGDKAVKYWDENTDGNNTSSKYEKMRKKIRDFSPNPKLNIPKVTQDIICF